MAIADRIESMYDHVEDVYDTITNVDLTDGENLFDISKVVASSTITNNGDTLTITTPLNTPYGEAGTPNKLSDYCPTLQVGDTVILEADSTGLIEGLSLSGNNYTYWRDWDFGEAVTITQNDLDSKVLWSKGGTSDADVSVISNLRIGEPFFKNIENIPNTIKKSYLKIMNEGSQDIWDSWDKRTSTGTEMSINGTEEAPMSLTYKGNTSQNGTPTPSSPIPVQVVSGDNSINVEGKNLFFVKSSNIPTTNWFEYNETTQTFTIKQGSGNPPPAIPLNINVNIGDTATISVICESGNFTGTATNPITIGLYHSSPASWQGQVSLPKGTNLAGNTYSTTYTFDKEVDSFELFIYGNPTISTNIVFKVQVELGSRSTTYEAYKGASYPISLGDKELCKIGTYQDKIDKSSGKNLFDGVLSAGYYITSTKTLTSTSSTVYKSFEINVKAGTYVMSCNTNINIVRAFTDYNNSSDAIFAGTTMNIKSYSMNITQDTKLYISVRRNDNTDWLTTDLLQLEKGTSSSEYEPYGTGWYLKKEIGKVVLNGNENWNLGSMFYTNILSNSPGIGASQIYSNYFKWTVGASDDNSIAVPGTAGSSNNYIWLKASQFETTSDLTTWLGTHNTIVYYPLATPTYEYITDTTLLSQLETLKKSYEGQTNISQVNNDLPFELDVVALSDGTASTLSFGSPLLGSSSQPEETQEEPQEEPVEEEENDISGV